VKVSVERQVIRHDPPQYEAIRLQPVCAVRQGHGEASFVVRAISRRTCGRSRQTKAIENRVRSVDKTDGQAYRGSGADPLVEVPAAALGVERLVGTLALVAPGG
jgi:hypothetical protein